MSKETKDKPVWKEDNKRFVCFLDIMGFKDMVYNENHLVVKNKLIALSQIRQQIIDVTTDLNNGVEKYPQYENCEIKPIAFSLSISNLNCGASSKPVALILLNNLLFLAIAIILSRAAIKLSCPRPLRSTSCMLKPEAFPSSLMAGGIAGFTKASSIFENSAIHRSFNAKADVSLLSRSENSFSRANPRPLF